MTRRAAAGIARLLPVLLIAGALLALATATGLAACGGAGGDDGATPTPAVTVTETPAVSPSPAMSASPSPAPAAETTALTVYFVRRGKLGTAERRVPQTTAVATAALKALLKGPSDAERAAGLASAVPGGVTLRRIAIEDQVAVVDLSGPFADGDAASLAARTAQVVYTATQFPNVRAVRLTVDGAPVEGVGGSSGAGLRRARFAALEPAIFVESPGVGAVLSSPFTLRGTASVYEGSFLAQLTDSSGRRVVRATVQASRGAPERGSFRKTIAFSTSAKEGTLLVYWQSPEDGSKQDAVRIPVTFAHERE